MFRRMLSFPKRNPFVFGAVFSCLKTSGADFMVQTYVEQRETINWKRNIAFGTFGLFYLGGVQYFIYVPLFGRMFPSASRFAGLPLRAKLQDWRGFSAMLSQVFLDQCVHHPFMYFPVFYATKELVAGGNLTTAKEKYMNNYKEDLVACWKVWVPATIINFTFSPMWLRIPFVAATSLVWSSILSAMRGSDDVEVVADKAEDIVLNPSRALERITRPHRLDPSLHHLVLTATGPDERKLVARVTERVVRSHGNIVTSKMMKLGGDFAIMMLVGLEHGQESMLRNSLGDLTQHSGGKLNITIHNSCGDAAPTTGGAPLAAGRMAHYEGKVSLHGADSPGLVHRVVEYLSEAGLDIADLNCHSSTFTVDGVDQVMFFLDGTIHGDEDIDTKALHDGIERLNHQLGVHITLEDL